MNGRHWCIRLALVAANVAIAGCSNAASQQELDFAKEVVQVSLDAWKRGERADTLQARATPIEFHDDDWRRAVRLVDYQVVQTYRETDGSPRCAVTLNVQYGSGKLVRKEVTYQLNTKPRIVIARDPYSQ